MKYFLLCLILITSISACSLNNIPGNQPTAMHTAQHHIGLKSIKETAEINQAYFQRHANAISALLTDMEYYRLMAYVINRAGASFTQPIMHIDAQITQTEHNKRNYQAPRTYEVCVRGTNIYNAYGLVGRNCHESVTHTYTEGWRKQQTQQAMAQFNQQLASLRQQRQQLVQKARTGGADSTLLAAGQHANQQIQAIQNTLNMHCNHLLKAPQVTWLHVEKQEIYNKTKRKIIIQPTVLSKLTATKDKDNCTFSVYYGFYPGNQYKKEAYRRFEANFREKLGLNIQQFNTLLADFGYKGSIW